MELGCAPSEHVAVFTNLEALQNPLFTDFHRGFLTWAQPIINSSSLEDGGMGHRPWSFWWPTSILKVSSSPSGVTSLEQKMLSSPRKFWGIQELHVRLWGKRPNIHFSQSHSPLHLPPWGQQLMFVSKLCMWGMYFDMKISLKPHNNLLRVHVHAQLCLTLCDPMDCSPPVSSVCWIFHARILEWVAISICRGSSWPGIEPASLVSPACISCVSCIERQILYHCATWKANLLREALTLKMKEWEVQGGDVIYPKSWSQYMRDQGFESCLPRAPKLNLPFVNIVPQPSEPSVSNQSCLMSWTPTWVTLQCQ